MGFVDLLCIFAQILHGIRARSTVACSIFEVYPNRYIGRYDPTEIVESFVGFEQKRITNPPRPRKPTYRKPVTEKKKTRRGKGLL